MSILLLYNIGREIYNKNTMKRKWEVTYYEYGLTKRKKRVFFFKFTAYLWKAWIEYNDIEADVEIKEVGNE